MIAFLLWPWTTEAVVSLSDGIGLDDIAAWCVAVTTICTFIWWLLRPLIRQAHRWDAFWDDWNGTPGGPGRDPVPGVMERLQRIDGELKRNGGHSLKDHVDQIGRKVDDLAALKAREHAQIRGAIDDLRYVIEGDAS